ncbi:MAG: hypothetical protein KDD70_06690 [Bdellovibrionales bacterium]|nr:hypothetical protein [Bdellovibrionales bacterium]
MQIFTVDDHDFPELLELFQNARVIGRFTDNGKVQFVRANKRLVMVSHGVTPESIAVRPVRTKDEALSVARALLAGEAVRGNSILDE